MGSYSLRDQALVIESIILLKVALTHNFGKFEVSERRTALKEAATDINFGDPGVLNDSVCDFGLHGPVHAIFCHQS